MRRAKRLAMKLAAVPLEYQASVYAKQAKLLRVKSEENQRKNLQKLRAHLKGLKEKLGTPHTQLTLDHLKNEIESAEKAIKKAPRPKSNWSPVLRGSFESSIK